MLAQKKLTDETRRSEIVEYKPQTSLAMPMAAPRAPEPSQADGMIRSLWRQRWSILVILLVTLGVAVIYLDRAPKIYTSRARIYLGDQRPVVSGQIGVPQSAMLGDLLWTEVEILKSSPVLTDAAKSLGLTSGLSEDDVARLVNRVRQNMSVDVGRKDNIINVDYDSPDRQEAAKWVNAIVDAYAAHRAHMSESSTNEVLDILKRKEDEQQNLRKLQFQALLDFKEQNPDFMINNPGANGMMAPTDFQMLRAQVSTAQLARIEAEANYEAAHQVATNPSKLRQMAGPAVIQQLDPAGAELRKQLSDVQLRLTVLLQHYPQGSPVLINDETLKKELESRITDDDQKFAEAYTGALYQDLLKATQKEQELQQLIEQEMAKFAKLNTKGAQYEKLNGELQQTDKLLTNLGDQIKTLDLQGQTAPFKVEVIEKGKPEDHPSKPAPGRTLALAVAIGLLLGCGFAIGRERLDQRVRSAEEIVALIGVPVMGVIPHMRRSLTPVARGQAVHWDPMSEVAEAYRAIRTAVNFGVAAGQSKTIVVTSPTPADGKSTLASNLSIAMAQAGKRVLLLDADFRRPSQHKLFEVSQEVGVTSVLAGRDTLSSAIQKTATEGLDLLPSGPIPLNPSELLNGESFAEILDELSGAYDHVVLDCPPVLAVTDARILGAVCDVTILVVRANKATRRTIEFARAGLASVGARLLGCVMNDVPRGLGADSYYSGYGYAPIEPVVRRREDAEPGATNGHRRLPSPDEADVVR